MTNTPSNSFAGFGLPEQLVKNLETAGMVAPKPIQEEALPVMLEGHDLLGIAQTGSGKTLAFSLPILAKIIAMGSRRKARTARALVLAPTRELAQQIADCFTTMAKDMHLSVALVLGGVSRFKQVKRVAQGVDILIATPGRLMDLVREREIDLSDTRYLVLDEADRMLDMGFIHDVRKIAAQVHKDRQTALFSATMPKEIAQLAASLLKDPVRVETAPQGTTAVDIREQVYSVKRGDKKRALLGLLADSDLQSVIVFARTKHGADAVTRDLQRNGVVVGVIHGNKTQNARQRALQGFRDGSIRVLVATDIAARGIDVPGISHVINYDLPDEAESYVHRIGRTGRNGASGIAITFYDPETENPRLRAVQRVTRKKFEVEIFPAEFLKRRPEPVEVVIERESEKKSFGKKSRGSKRPEGSAKRQGQNAGKPRRSRAKFRDGNAIAEDTVMSANAGKPVKSGKPASGDTKWRKNASAKSRPRRNNKMSAAA